MLLCNNLGAPVHYPLSSDSGISSDGQSSLSIKEAVRVAQSNNFMGMVCQSRILKAVPALVESIKVAGLVLVADASTGPQTSHHRTAYASSGVPDGVAGQLSNNGVMRFNETIDV